jgi:hypothetical protein
MKEKFSQFECEYFIQTRKEIDNEKHERDALLNFVVAVLGALAFAIFKDFSADKFDATLKGGLPVGLAVCGVSFITVVISIRYQKLRQIAGEANSTTDIATIAICCQAHASPHR